MWRDYPNLITESIAELWALERQHRGRRTVSRIRMLRLLKSGAVRSQQQAAEMLGYSETQLGRWWQCYEEQGLPGLLVIAKPSGKPSQITPDAWAGLQAELEKGRIGGLEDARQYLQDQWGVRYESLSGLWRMLQKRHVKFSGKRGWQNLSEGVGAE